MKEIIAGILHQQLILHHFTAITIVADLYMDVHLGATKKTTTKKTNKKAKKSADEALEIAAQ